MKDRQLRQYATANDFRIALETRLNSIAQQESTDPQRLRRQVSFDRLLARLFANKEVHWLLKGGYAMELWMQTARATKDIDLSVPAEATVDIKRHILECLQDSAGVNLNDFFVFSVGQPKMSLVTAPEGGARYPIIASVANRRFTTFQIDVGVGDPVIYPPVIVQGRDWLGFAGIEPANIIAICKEQQFAEKLHAYTVPRKSGENSRVKDLVDLALLSMEKLDPVKLEKAIKTTFAVYATHEIPPILPNPPSSWKEPYLALANECNWKLTMEQSLQAISATMVKHSKRRGISL